MQHLKIMLMGTFLVVMLFTACEEATDDPIESTDLYTQDINAAPQFFTFENASFDSNTYDLKFELAGQSYLVSLNSAAGVIALATDTLSFDTETLPVQGFALDGDTKVIGASWMDISTYNPADHSIGSGNMIYFLRSNDYNWVKFRVLSASPSKFNIEYSIYTDGTGYGPVHADSIMYDSGNPGYYSISAGETVTPIMWDMCLATIPEYSTELSSNFYMPTLYFNHEAGVEVAFVDDVDYEDMTEIPSGMMWTGSMGLGHSFGNGGEHQVLVYHPEPPYNHKVLVENPDRVYLIKTANNDYKLQFTEYSSGIVVFKSSIL